MMKAIGRGALEKLGVPVARTKDGVLDLRGSLSNLAQWIPAHPGFGAAEMLTKAFGIHGAQAELLAAQLSKVGDAQKALASSSGAAARAHQITESTASRQYQILKNNLDAVAERLADVALLALTRWIERLSNAARAAADFLGRHQTIAGVLAAAALAFGALTTAAGGLLLTLGQITIAGGYTLKLFSQFVPVLKLAASGWETFALRAMYAWEALAQGEGVMAALSALLGTWGLIIAAAAMLGLTAYEVYEQWSTVKAVLWDVVYGTETALNAMWQRAGYWGPKLVAALVAPWAMVLIEIYQHWDRIKATFNDETGWMRTSALNMMKSLGEGILAGIEWPFKTAEHVAEKIGGFFHFHSPPE